jgi:hypothetical protein
VFREEMVARQVDVELTKKLGSSHGTDGPVGSREASNREIYEENNWVKIHKIVGLTFIVGTAERCNGVDVGIHVRRPPVETDCLTVV